MGDFYSFVFLAIFRYVWCVCVYVYAPNIRMILCGDRGALLKFVYVVIHTAIHTIAKNHTITQTTHNLCVLKNSSPGLRMQFYCSLG